MSSSRKPSLVWQQGYITLAAILTGSLRIQSTDVTALDEMLHVALENAVASEVAGNDERRLYWLRCAMLAQDEMTRRKSCQQSPFRTRSSTDSADGCWRTGFPWLGATGAK